MRPPSLTLMIRLPASGKSTVAKQIHYNDIEDGASSVIISNDIVGKMLTGQQFCKSAGGFITSIAELMARYFLSQGTNVIVDNTCLTQGSRSKWFKVGIEFNCSIRAYFMNTPVEECVKRNASREDSVPMKLIYDMAEKLQPPEEQEGFEFINFDEGN